MKSIKYILLAIILSSILVAAIPVKPIILNKNNTKYTLECVDENAKKEDIIKSVIILKKRLKSAGVKFKLRLKDDNSILVITKTKDSTRVKGLLTADGNVGFYLPYRNQEGINNILKNEKLTTIYNGEIDFTKDSESISIKASEENKFLVDEFFKNNILTKPEYKDLEIAWSKIKNEKGLYELYLLAKEGSLDGSYISKTYAQRNKNTDAIEIMIIFSKEGAKLWEDLTENNINRILAIVLDGEVYSAPKISSKISGGKAMISGNFTENEAINMAVLLQNGELPLKFRIIE